MIQAIIFDCFGVLYGGSLSKFVAIAPSEHRRAIVDVNSAKDYGYISYHEYLEQVATLTQRSRSDIEAIIREYHHLNQPLFDYTQKLRPAYKTGLLSNIGDQIGELFEGKADQYFDQLILSYQVGLAKPSPEIFILAAERLGVPPSDCVMIDDIEENCEGAEVAGLRAILYTSNETTIAKLEELLGR